MLDSLVGRMGQMRQQNYRHKKSGWRFDQLTDLKVVEHIAAEVIELAAAVTEMNVVVQLTSIPGGRPDKKINIIEEIADVRNTLAHLMSRLEITEDEVLNEAHRKLDLRFEP